MQKVEEKELLRDISNVVSKSLPASNMRYIDFGNAKIPTEKPKSIGIFLNLIQQETRVYLIRLIQRYLNYHG